LSKPEVSRIMDKYFVRVMLDVSEHGDKKVLENPGGDAYVEAGGGKDSGLPYFYFTDPAGKSLINSKRPAEGTDKGGNIGCPYEANEIAWWLTCLHTAAPKMTSTEIASIKASFEGLKKADGKGG
jgi:hypothetical protein